MLSLTLIKQIHEVATPRTYAISLGAGLTTALLLFRPMLRLRIPRLFKPNYSGAPVPVTGGPLIAIALAAWLAASLVLFQDVVQQADGLGFDGDVLVLALLGFFLLGLVDDALGTTGSKGFGGHARALMQGRLTTGLIKAAGGAVVAFLVSATISTDSVVWLITRALVIVLSANLINLLDLRPGRATKSYLVVTAFVCLALVVDPRPRAGSAYLLFTFFMIGTVLIWLVADLRARGMLGDSGSNMLGASAGIGLVVLLPPWGQAVAAAVLLALNLASEKWSFSKVIDAVPPLRWFDGLGRKREETSALVP